MSASARGAAWKSSFEEFTERGYRRILATARRHYRFRPFGTREKAPHVLWRHDVDFSVHRALRIAAIDAAAGARSTFFFWPHSPFYNLLEKTIAARVQAIAAMGHHIGLHFDQSYYGPRLGLRTLERALAAEKRILEDICAGPVLVFSLHDPTPLSIRKLARDQVAGMLNVYGRAIRSQYEYCSDSNGYWRHRRLPDVLAQGGHERLHVLTHPEWWVPRAMSPRQRVARCIEGRAASVAKGYDDVLRRGGRLNVGRR